MADEYLNRIERFLERHGIETYHFERRAKHRAVVVEYRGKVCFVVFPTTGSDRRGPARTVSDLRHALGLVGTHANENKQVRKAQRPLNRRRSRPQRVKALSIETPVSQPDKFYAPLMLLKERLTAAAKSTSTIATGKVNGRPEQFPTPARRVRLLTPWLGTRPRYATL